MNPTLQQLLQRSFPRHELAALADARARVTLRQGRGAMAVELAGMSARLVNVRGDATESLAPGMRGMLSIEIGDGSIRCDIPIEVVAAGRTSSVLRMLATPLVLRRRMVRDQQLGEALGAGPRNEPAIDRAVA